MLLFVFRNQLFKLFLLGKVDCSNGGKVDINLYSNLSAGAVAVMHLDALDQGVDQLRRQFLHLCELSETFQQHPQIDAIEVVCLDGWHDVLRAYAKQFGITKLENIDLRMFLNNILTQRFLI